jgi:rhamnose utilization protein RhaD (predicted bifunctional aldolase and dehydrogenase)
MKNLWDPAEAAKCKSDLELRVYTSRLLGRDDTLVLHGGGNTSVKVRERNVVGEEEEILYVKGSGWDLETIEVNGFAVRSQRSEGFGLGLAEAMLMAKPVIATGYSGNLDS